MNPSTATSASFGRGSGSGASAILTSGSEPSVGIRASMEDTVGADAPERKDRSGMSSARGAMNADRYIQPRSLEISVAEASIRSTAGERL